MHQIDNVLQHAKRVHFIGIGGAGMCPLAEILHTQNYIISGSDINESETFKRVKSLGITTFLQQCAENIVGADLIVYTAALLPDNPELVAAKASGIPTFERAALLAAITRRFSNCIGVCGTHGKTTTTAMMAHIMQAAKLDPTAVVGGRLAGSTRNALVGKSDAMIVEACEYQDAFLQYSPDVAVILNIDEDHMEYFKTLENLLASFRKFAEIATKTVIYNGDDANTRLALEGMEPRKLVSFGRTEGCDFRAANVTMNGALASYDLIYRGEPMTRISLAAPGEHNVSNSLAAIAAAMLSGVGALDCETALADFRGAGRRFEVLGTHRGITIADDYAHHPREIEVALTAARQMDYQRVWAVFQPFTFSRTALLLDDFAEALKLADHVVMTAIMGSREVNTWGISTADLAAKLPGSAWYESFSEVAQHIATHAQEGDLVLTLGCGDIYKAAHMMIDILQQ
ncbi:MAG: UDP-N-acetylmuramate--L-alanine ligase [Oscillospiraceae bacterium]|nr:UDP-N-acetylmuramate--L-alanine ligase [Oscillospiraceae bacterium]